MNTRSHTIEIQCNYADVSDITRALVHSVIFFRTHGKFNYKHEGSYSIGTLGFERANSSNQLLSYIRCSSSLLVDRVNAKIEEFVSRINESTISATFAIEFYTKRQSRWPFNDARIIWELWNFKIVLNQPLSWQPSNDPNRQLDTSSRLEDTLSNKLLDIVLIVNDEKCHLPSMPTQANLNQVFDTSYSDLQPYLHTFSYRMNESSAGQSPLGGGTTSKQESSAITDSSTQSSLKRFLLGTLEL